MVACFPYRTDVIVAAANNSYDLTKKETVFAELGITAPTPAENTQMDTNIHQASALAARYCNREFASETLKDYFRPADRRCVAALWLSRTPVTAIAAVIEDGVTLASDKYELDSKTGQLWRMDGSGNRTRWARCALTTVQFTGGYVLLTDLPFDVERACIDQVKAMFQGRKRDPAVRSFQIPDVYQEAVSVAGGDSFGASGLLAQVEGALAPYRIISVA